MKNIAIITLALGLTGISFAGEGEDLRSGQAGLPAITAGEILSQIASQPPSPQPVPTCVLTGFKNSSCDFSTGEATGPCAIHKTLAIPAQDVARAEEAAKELRKELKGRNIYAGVTVVSSPGRNLRLAIEFENWNDYEKLNDLLYKAPGGNPGYMGLEIYTRVPKREGIKADLNWKSIRLQASDGTQIVVDYSSVDLGGSMIAAPLWITVANKAFRGNEKVRVTLMTYYEATVSSADAIKETKELELPYNGSAFQMKGPNMDIYEGHHAWTHTFRQEIAVSVNGMWLTDPVNGTHNFKFKLIR